MASAEVPGRRVSSRGLAPGCAGIVRSRRNAGRVKVSSTDCVPHHGLIGEADAVGRQNASQGMDEDCVNAKLVGNEAGVLATRAAEAVQGETADVLTFLDGNMLMALAILATAMRI